MNHPSYHVIMKDLCRSVKVPDSIDSLFMVIIHILEIKLIVVVVILYAPHVIPDTPQIKIIKELYL